VAKVKTESDYKILPNPLSVVDLFNLYNWEEIEITLESVVIIKDLYSYICPQ
jgi:hypothetical protein